jgi:hypothetical protein
MRNVTLYCQATPIEIGRGDDAIGAGDRSPDVVVAHAALLHPLDGMGRETQRDVGIHRMAGAPSEQEPDAEADDEQRRREQDRQQVHVRIPLRRRLRKAARSYGRDGSSVAVVAALAQIVHEQREDDAERHAE